MAFPLASEPMAPPLCIHRRTNQLPTHSTLHQHTYNPTHRPASVVLQIAVAVAIALALALPRLRPYRDYRRRCFYRLLKLRTFPNASFFLYSFN